MKSEQEIRIELEDYIDENIDVMKKEVKELKKQVEFIVNELIKKGIHDL